MIIGNVPAGPTDLIRQLVNLAVNSGRSLQSSQTGFVHYCYRQLDYMNHDTMPLYENFLFVLALMRERTAESFAEAKSLVEKLLYFQDPESGNFPVYIHEYPLCKDRNLAAHLLPVFYWILRTFPSALGQALRDRFQASTEKAVNFCLKLKEERLQFPIALKIACSLKVLGDLWAKPDWTQTGDTWLEELLNEARQGTFTAWYVPATCGDCLISLQLVYPSIAHSPWVALWNHLENTWNAYTASYVGPAYHQHQVKEQPEVTLLDLIMGFQTGNYSYRTLLNGPHMLQAALIHPTQDVITPIELPNLVEGTVQGRRWYVRQYNQWACSLLEKQSSDPAKNNTYSAIQLLWGDLNCAHTFVCQGGNIERIEYVVVENGVDLLLTLCEEIPTEARQKNREVNFFLDAHEDVSFYVNQLASATAFQMGDPVRICSANMNIGLKLVVDQGNGQFFGHIAMGNRPSQKYTSGEGRFKAYDWHLFLRTLDRESVCRIRAEIRFVVDGG